MGKATSDGLSVIEWPASAAVRQIGQAEIAEALPFPKLIAAMANALEHMVSAPLRLCVNGQGQRELLVMPAMSARFAGVKILTINPDNGTKGLPVIDGAYVLLDSQTGSLLAMIDASELTARRTAALSALASSRLSRSDSSLLTILGTGHLAPYMAQAHCAVRPISKVAIWGRDPTKTAVSLLAVKQRLPGIEIAEVGDLATAIGRSDIVCSATRAEYPLIYGDWLSPGTHVDLVGGYRPNMREIDDVGIAHATIYVDTVEGVLAEAGDLRSPIERGIITPAAIKGNITALMRGPGRTSPAEITLFKSVGSAPWDLMAAELVWEARLA